MLSPPACHTENVDDTGNTVKPVPPAAVNPNIFTGQPPAACKSAFNGRLKVRCYGNKDIDCNNGKGKYLKPFLLAYAPFVLKHHKADTACCCRIKLGIMEPTVHINMSLVIQCPFCSCFCTYGNSNKVNRQRRRKNKETENSACL